MFLKFFSEVIKVSNRLSNLRGVERLSGICTDVGRISDGISSPKQVCDEM